MAVAQLQREKVSKVQHAAATYDPNRLDVKFNISQQQHVAQRRGVKNHRQR